MTDLETPSIELITPDYIVTYVTETSQISEMINLFEKCRSESAILFIDTEFTREHTYRADLNLIQCAFLLSDQARADSGKDKPYAAYVIDMQSPELEISAFIELLKDPEILKVLHASRQDNEIFHNRFNFIPAPLFDTQIAGSFLGMGDQIGFEALIKTVTGAFVDKSLQRTDWSKRPLTDEKILYAAADVGLLIPAYQKIQKNLATADRTEWVKEETEPLLNEKLYLPDADNVFRRIKKPPRDEDALYLLKKICDFRENVAEKNNIARVRIFSDDLAIKIAEQAPASFEDLKKIRGVSDRFLFKFGEDFIAFLNEARAVPAELRPVIIGEERVSFSRDKEILSDFLKLSLKIIADHLNLPSRYIASSQDLTQFILTGDAPFLHGWRKTAAGQTILTLSSGSASLRMNPDKGEAEIIV